MQKAIIFDLDGTLLETIEDITDCVNTALTKYGFPTITVQRCISIINNGAKELIKDALPVTLPEEKFNEIFNYYVSVYFNYDSPRTYAYEGIEEVLNECKKAGYKVAVVTNKHIVITEKLLKSKLPNFNFDGIIGVKEGVIPKPNPTSTLNLLKDLGVEPQNAIFVGDGDTDVKTAQNANLFCIAVLWGYRSKTVLQTLGATNFAEKPNEILKYINQ